MYNSLKTPLQSFLIYISHLSQVAYPVQADCSSQHRGYHWTTTIPSKTFRIKTSMTLWCHLVLIAHRMAEPKRKDRRVGWLNGSISLCSNLRRRGRSTRERGRRKQEEGGGEQIEEGKVETEAQEGNWTAKKREQEEDGQAFTSASWEDNKLMITSLYEPEVF